MNKKSRETCLLKIHKFHNGFLTDAARYYNYDFETIQKMDKDEVLSYTISRFSMFNKEIIEQDL